MPAPQSGPPTEAMPDSVEARLSMLEHSLYEMHTRLARTEESHSVMTSKCQELSENLTRSYQVRSDEPTCTLKADAFYSTTLKYQTSLQH